MVVALVLIVAVLNLGLGFAVAELWSRCAGSETQPLESYTPLPVESFPSDTLPDAAVEPEPPPESIAAPPVEIAELETDLTLPSHFEAMQVDASVVAAATHDIPAEWLASLQSIGPIQSVVEAAIEVLKLQVGEYRDQLVEIDRQVRGLTATSDGVARMACLGVLREVNQEWREQQRTASQHLQARQNRLGEHRPLGGSLIEILDRQAAQIDSTFVDTAEMNLAADFDTDRQTLLREIGLLLDLAHQLRDCMHQATVQLLRSEERWQSLDQARFSDEQTGLRNLLGMESLFHEWWKNDPTRQRPLCVAFLDVDGFGQLNLDRGWALGDRLLRGVGAMIADSVRRSRGFDRAGRIAGQQFMFFLGETGPRGATSAIERIRQTLAATTFEDRAGDFQITGRCGLIEVGPHESTSDVFARLTAATTTARQQGGNCTAFDDGNGAVVVEPLAMKVPARVIRLRD